MLRSEHTQPPFTTSYSRDRVLSAPPLRPARAPRVLNRPHQPDASLPDPVESSITEPSMPTLTGLAIPVIPSLHAPPARCRDPEIPLSHGRSGKRREKPYLYTDGELSPVASTSSIPSSPARKSSGEESRSGSARRPAALKKSTARARATLELGLDAELDKMEEAELSSIVNTPSAKAFFELGEAALKTHLVHLTDPYLHKHRELSSTSSEQTVSSPPESPASFSLSPRSSSFYASRYDNRPSAIKPSPRLSLVIESEPSETLYSRSRLTTSSSTPVELSAGLSSRFGFAPSSSFYYTSPLTALSRTRSFTSTSASPRPSLQSPLRHHSSSASSEIQLKKSSYPHNTKPGGDGSELADDPLERDKGMKREAKKEFIRFLKEGPKTYLSNEGQQGTPKTGSTNSGESSGISSKFPFLSLGKGRKGKADGPATFSSVALGSPLEDETKKMFGQNAVAIQLDDLSSPPVANRTTDERSAIIQESFPAPQTLTLSPSLPPLSFSSSSISSQSLSYPSPLSSWNTDCLPEASPFASVKARFKAPEARTLLGELISTLQLFQETFLKVYYPFLSLDKYDKRASVDSTASTTSTVSSAGCPTRSKERALELKSFKEEILAAIEDIIAIIPEFRRSLQTGHYGPLSFETSPLDFVEVSDGGRNWGPWEGEAIDGDEPVWWCVRLRGDLKREVWDWVIAASAPPFDGADALGLQLAEGNRLRPFAMGGFRERMVVETSWAREASITESSVYSATTPLALSHLSKADSYGLEGDLGSVGQDGFQSGPPSSGFAPATEDGLSKGDPLPSEDERSARNYDLW